MKHAMTFALLLLSAAAFCQELEDPTKCPYCKTTGKLVNPFYEKNEALLEQAIYCSWAMEKDKEGLGLPWIPCAKCKNPPLKLKAVKEFDGLAKKRLAWLEERRKVDETVKAQKPLFHLETEHFVWAWSIPKITWEKKQYRGHEALYLFAGLMEQFYSDYQRVHQITDRDNINNKHYIYCFERRLNADKACVAYGEQASPNGKVTKQTKPSVFVMWWDKSKLPTAEAIHRDMIHNVAHLFVAVFKTWWWLYESGVAYEGHAHWWEIYYYDKATSYCFRESDSGSNWVAEKWPSRVKKAVLAGKEPSLTELLALPGGSLDFKEHVFAWSYIDYMMFMDPRKTLTFCDVLKQKRPAREAFSEAWGKSILAFEEEWKEYVKTEYSVQEMVVPSKRNRRR
jgi:hypothetical protein